MNKAAEAMLDLLNRRGAGKTICPSEVARLISVPGGDWRAQMGAVHEAADALKAKGQIRLSWKGEEIDQRRGAYRIGAADRS